MKNKNTVNTAILLIQTVITLAIWSLLLWDHVHGGVPSHHLLANENLPEVSNWWGAIAVPLTSFFLLKRIKKRIHSKGEPIPAYLIRKECYAFVAALIYGTIIAVSFTTGNTEISGFLFLGMLAIALFFPIYRSAYFLGFLTGMMYTFGGVLPILIGGLMSLICYLLFILFHPLLIKIGNKTGLIKSRVIG